MSWKNNLKKDGIKNYETSDSYDSDQDDLRLPKKSQKRQSTQNKKDEQPSLKVRYNQLKGRKQEKKSSYYFPRNLKPDILSSADLNNGKRGYTSFGVDADNLFMDAIFTESFQEMLYLEFLRLSQKQMKIPASSQNWKDIVQKRAQQKQKQENLMNSLLQSVHSKVVKAIQTFFVRLKPLLKMMLQFNNRLFIVFDGDRLPKKQQIKKDKQKYLNKKEQQLMIQKDKKYIRFNKRIKNEMIIKIMELTECLNYSLQKQFQRNAFQQGDIDAPTSPCFIQIVVAPYGADQQLIWLWRKRKIHCIVSKDYGYCYYNIPMITDMKSLEVNIDKKTQKIQKKKNKRSNVKKREKDKYYLIQISQASKLTHFKNEACEKLTHSWIDKTYVKDDSFKRLFFLALRGSSYSQRFSQKSLDLNQQKLTNNIFSISRLMLLVMQSEYKRSNQFGKQVQELANSFWSNAYECTNGLLPRKMAQRFFPHILDAMKIFYFHTIRSFSEAKLNPLNFKSPMERMESEDFFYSSGFRLPQSVHEYQKIKYCTQQQFQNLKNQFGPGMKSWQLKRMCQSKKIQQYLKDKSEQQKRQIRQNIRIAELVGEYGYNYNDYDQQKRYQNGEIYRKIRRGQNRFLLNLKKLEDCWQMQDHLNLILNLQQDKQFPEYEGLFSKMLNYLFETQQQGKKKIFQNFYQQLNDNRKVLFSNYQAMIYQFDSRDEEGSEREESQEQDEQEDD